MPLKRFLRMVSGYNLSILPLKPKTKVPGIATWEPYQSAPPSPKELEEWLDKYPNYNVGIVTGEVSGLVVLDVDSCEAEEFLKGLNLPQTLTAKTARGRHYYFRYPTSGIGNRVKVNGVDFDIRGEGGYVVAPPSVHEDGTIYEWENWGAFTFENLSDFPTDLLLQTTKYETITPEERQRRFADKAIHEEVAAVVSAKQGERNNRLNMAAFNLGQLVPHGLLDENSVKSRLMNAAVACGLSQDDGEVSVVRTIESGLADGMLSPRQLPDFSSSDFSNNSENSSFSNNSENSSPGGQANEWPEPEPLVAPFLDQSLPYPADAFPTVVRDAMIEFQRYGQQPMPLIGGACLASLSLAIQGLVDVARDDVLVGPSSLYILTVAESGERKSAADKFVSGPLRSLESELQQKAKEKIKEARSAERAYKVKLQAAEKYLKDVSLNGDEAEISQAERKLMDLIDAAPKVPLSPILIFEDTTQEGFMQLISDGYPSVAIWSDEAGLVTGGYSMASETLMRTLATYNKLWDGSVIKATRKMAESNVVDGRRGTINLAMQRSVMEKLLGTGNEISRGIGFIARALFSMPSSTIGTRMYRDPPEHSPAFEVYRNRMKEILELPLPVADEDTFKLEPPCLKLDEAAHKVWVEYFNSIEQECHKLGRYGEIGDIASKSAENAARIAAIFHVFEKGTHGRIDADTMSRSVQLARWYLDEMLRVLDRFSTPEPLLKAQKLWDWLVRNGSGEVELSSIASRLPNELRPKSRRDPALEVLEGHGLLRRLEKPKRVLLNPKALEQEETD